MVEQNQPDDAALDPTGSTWALVPPLGERNVAEATLAEFASRWIMQVADVGAIGRYAEDNRRLLVQPKPRRRIVFLGDSITEFWGDMEGLAPADVQLINRGIAGQGAVQLLLRIQEDVVALSPDALVLTIGTNDIRAFVGEASRAGAVARVRIARNIRSLCDIARAHRIAIALGALPPVRDVDPVRHTTQRDPGQIVAMDAWIRSYAAASGFVFLDYHTALVGADGLLVSDCTDDGLHPNAEGYARMGAVLRASGVLDG